MVIGLEGLLHDVLGSGDRGYVLCWRTSPVEGVSEASSSTLFCAVSKRISYQSSHRRACRYSGCLKRNSCSTNAKASSIGTPQRRSARYSFMNSAESSSWVPPASICMDCSSVAGASTLSEARVTELYQYIFLCPPLPKGRC